MRTKQWIKDNVPSLDGKTYIVTGANSGIGFEVTKILALKGAHVFMACRSKKRADEAIDSIKSFNKKAKLTFIEYDQADLAKIASFVQNLAKLDLNISGFVANAGVYYPSKDAKTKQGYPLTFGVNFLGVYYLIKELVNNNILKEDDTRLVLVGSLAESKHYPEDFEKWFHESNASRNAQYNHSKGALKLLSLYLMNPTEFEFNDFKLPDKVKTYFIHPGITNTNIIREANGGFSGSFVKAGRNFLKIFFQNPERAALTIITALISSEDGKNKVIHPRGLFAISGLPTIKNLNTDNMKYVPDFIYSVEKELSTNLI